MSDPRYDPRVSLGSVVAASVVLSLALCGLQSLGRGVSNAEAAFGLASFVSIAGGTAWLLELWRPRVARWFIVLTSALFAYLGYQVLNIPGMLSLGVVSAALAVALLGVREAVVFSVLYTLWILGVWRYGSGAVVGTDALAALLALWCALGAVSVLVRFREDRIRWFSEQYEAALLLKEEAQESKVRLEGTAHALENASRQLLVANERMSALRAIAEDAEKTKALFVAKVSHEFRTPLNMIIGLAELMLETPEIYAVALPPVMRHDLEVILRNCRHLSSMIDDVLDLTRVESGRMMLRKERVDLGEIVRTAVSAVSPLMQKKGLQVQVDVPTDLPLVYCDRARIRQVILNLVSNAARFTDQGRIVVQARLQELNVLVQVIDTGPGIAPHDIERIFEPFGQSSDNLWHDRGGSGLGLSISQQFVRLHQGRMWVESEVGAGSTFSFVLPVSPPVEHAARPVRWIREDWVWQEESFRTDQVGLADQPRLPRVVVQDSTGGLIPELRRYTDDLELVSVDTVDELGATIRLSPADAVLVNANSPDELLPVAVRAAREMPGTPIVGCTVPQRAQRADDHGAAGYLLKPVTRRQLQEALDSAGAPATHVLVVDDNRDARDLFVRMLRACNESLTVDTASDGREALARLRTTSYEVVLLDVVLPDLDGWQVLEALRQDCVAKMPAVFFVSAQDPADQPPASGVMLTVVSTGVAIDRLLRCSLEVSGLLLRPDGALDPAPPQIVEAGSVLTGMPRRPVPVPAQLP